MSSLAAVTRSTLWKDLRLEWRSKDAINSMLFFSLLVVVIFSFAFNPTAEESRLIQPAQSPAGRAPVCWPRPFFPHPRVAARASVCHPFQSRP